MRYIIIFSLYLFSCASFATNPLVAVSAFFYKPDYQAEKINTTLFPDTLPPRDRAIFIFDPQNLAWAVYNKKGKRVGIGAASGGKDYCPDINKPCRTVEGEFTVFRSEDEDCTSKTFPIDEGGGAPMPHCIFFYKGYAIHGSKNLPHQNVSHGCIRVSKAAAEWMNTYFIKPGALVIVKPYA